MAVNIFQQVVTYNKSLLAILQNQFAFIETANKKFLNFNTAIPYNLGSTVSYTKPPRMTSTNSLVVTVQGTEQRVQNLTVNKEQSVAYEFTDEQFIFNAEQFINEYGDSAMAQLGTVVEADVAELAETNTFRFYGDGVTPISTSLQLATAVAFLDEFGSAKTNRKGYLANMSIPGIVNTNANQFTPDRNNKQVMSWQLGDFADTKWYRSNLLKTHLSGTEGNAASVLTVVSTVLDADGAVVQITFSGAAAASDANSVKAYDKFVFSDGVGAFANLRYLTWTGYKLSQCPVQFRATANAASNGASQVVVNIYPPLQVNVGRNQNINTPIVAGMQATVLPNHKCGLLMAGDPLYLAMPKLPNVTPFPSSALVDKDSGAAVRMYYGAVLGQAKQLITHDTIWGRALSDEYAMMIAFPA